MHVARRIDRLGLGVHMAKRCTCWSLLAPVPACALLCSARSAGCRHLVDTQLEFAAHVRRPLLVLPTTLTPPKQPLCPQTWHSPTSNSSTKLSTSFPFTYRLSHRPPPIHPITPQSLTLSALLIDGFTMAPHLGRTMLRLGSVAPARLTVHSIHNVTALRTLSSTAIQFAKKAAAPATTSKKSPVKETKPAASKAKAPAASKAAASKKAPAKAATKSATKTAAKAPAKKTTQKAAPTKAKQRITLAQVQKAKERTKLQERRLRERERQKAAQEKIKQRNLEKKLQAKAKAEALKFKQQQKKEAVALKKQETKLRRQTMRERKLEKLREERMAKIERKRVLKEKIAERNKAKRAKEQEKKKRQASILKQRAKAAKLKDAAEQKKQEKKDAIRRALETAEINSPSKIPLNSWLLYVQKMKNGEKNGTPEFLKEVRPKYKLMGEAEKAVSSRIGIQRRI